MTKESIGNLMLLNGALKDAIQNLSGWDLILKLVEIQKKMEEILKKEIKNARQPKL